MFWNKNKQLDNIVKKDPIVKDMDEMISIWSDDIGYQCIRNSIDYFAFKYHINFVLDGVWKGDDGNYAAKIHGGNSEGALDWPVYLQMMSEMFRGNSFQRMWIIEMMSDCKNNTFRLKVGFTINPQMTI